MKARLGVSVLAIAAAAFAAGWHFGLFEAPATLPGTPRSAEQSPAAPGPKPAESASAATETKSEQAAAEATPPAAAPSFDIVRVEPDGAAVVAGRAAPNATVSLQSGTERLAEVKTDASGAFALDLTLPVGQHRLALNDGAQPAGSARSETAIVNVPEKGREGELLVMLERPGEASEILVKPEPETAAAEPAPAPVEQAAVTPPAPSAAPAAPASAPAAAQPASPLSVEAVEAEGGKLFVAGAAAERARVRVYLDDALVSETQGGPGDRFVASADAPVAVGDHVVRADQVDASGQVVARVEVPFNRPDTAPLAAIAPPAAAPAPSAAAPAPAAPSAEPAPAETELAAASAPAAAPAAAPGNTTVQPALERVEARVIIRKGDTLWRISRSTYGRGSRFTVIYLANGDQIRDPNRIYPGQVFRVPDREG